MVVVDVFKFFYTSVLQSTYVQFLQLGLIPLSHKEKRQLMHAQRTMVRPSHLRKLILFTFLCFITLTEGLTITWRKHFTYVKAFNVNEKPRYRRPTLYDGRCRFQQSIRAREAYLLRAYSSSLRPSKGWESTPKSMASTAFHLQAESLLLTRLYSRFTSSNGIQIMPLHPTIAFNHGQYTAPKRFFDSGLPDMADYFGMITPRTPAVYSTTSQMYDACHLQSRAETQYSICFDTGCSLASTFSLDDFESPPVKGSFGQLRTINGIVPIEAAGIIRWTVTDVNGAEAIIRVPGYHIPTSTQRLFSPQNYAAYHQWANAATDCYGGNDKWFWMKIATSGTGEQQEVRMPISALDGLPYLQGKIINDKSTCQTCSA